MPIFRDLSAMLLKGCLAALMMLVGVSPVVAEIGHLADALVHEEAASSGEVEAEGPADEQDKAPPVEKAAHCAFSHCAAGVPATPPARSAAHTPAPAESFSAFVGRLGPAAPRDGPERPPQA